MQNEMIQCQNCKNDFLIEKEDFDFYAKVNVPPPTFCSTCRFQRRLMFRNERILYRRKCDLCASSMVSIFSPDRPQPVYCGPCWLSDSWDPRDYGVPYDSSKPFFEQLHELTNRVPCMNLIVDHGTLVNSEYINHAGSSRDCYLSFNIDFCDNVLYSSTAVHLTDSMDVIMSQDSSLLYEAIDCSGSRIFFSENCNNCVDVSFSKDCNGCIACFGCVGLRNKSYYIWNEPHTKESYEEKIKEIRTDSFETVTKLRKQARDFWATYPRRFYYGTHNVGSQGEYMYECKNAKYMYQTVGVEDSKFCQFLTLASTRDSYDMTEWGMNSEQVVDAITVGENCVDIKYCAGAWSNCEHTEYCLYVISSKNLFGCVNMRKQEYCILNKQYTKEEYIVLREKIISEMNNSPYIDQMGRKWAYGDFLPYDLSFFAYNESQATQFFPLNENDVTKKGYRWKVLEKPSHAITCKERDIPDSILETPKTFTNEVLSCISCERPYRIVIAEFELLQRFVLPLPRQCADCRHKDRIKRLNPPTFFNRKCDKCALPISTTYTPERTEIVYCEACYQQEMI